MTTKVDITDVTLLAVLLTQEGWDRFPDLADMVQVEHNIKPLFRDVKDYAKTVHNVINVRDFIVWFKKFGKYTFATEHQQAYYNSILTQLETIEVTPELILLTAKEYYGQKMREKLTKFSETTINTEALRESIDEYERATVDENRFAAITHSLDPRLTTEDRKSTGFKFRLDILNECVGPLSTGDFMLVFAYPNTGKTALIASEVTFIASQIEEGKILFFNNEESTKQVQDKLQIAALQQPSDVIKAYPDEAAAALTKKFNGDLERIIVVDAIELSVSDIRQFCIMYDVKLIVIDQLDKIHITGEDKDSDVTRLGKLYSALRQIANTICPVIVVCQSSGDAIKYNKDEQQKEQKLFPSLDALEGSRIKKQGEMDYVVGIGLDEKRKKIRGIYVSKSKYLKQSMDNKRVVNFDGALQRYSNP